jgi:excisionase family DNA binding protein
VRAVLTVPEVAEALDMSTDAVYAMLRDNVIPHFRYGRKYIIGRVAFDKWLAGCGAPVNAVN